MLHAYYILDSVLMLYMHHFSYRINLLMEYALIIPF